MEEARNAVYVPAKQVRDTPWKHPSGKAEIRIMARELPNWTIEKATQIRQKLHPRKRGKMLDKQCLLMPLVPFGGVKDYCATEGNCFSALLHNKTESDDIPHCK